jgi:hypothetical protein
MSTMSVTTFEGVVENGKIRLPPDIRLPEKAKGYVVIPDAEIAQRVHVGSPRLAHPAQAKDFKKQLIEAHACV